jgi:hypothetical protein
MIFRATKSEIAAKFFQKKKSLMKHDVERKKERKKAYDTQPYIIFLYPDYTPTITVTTITLSISQLYSYSYDVLVLYIRSTSFSENRRKSMSDDGWIG